MFRRQAAHTAILAAKSSSRKILQPAGGEHLLAEAVAGGVVGLRWKAGVVLCVVTASASLAADSQHNTRIS